MISPRRELFVVVAAVLAYASCRASSEPSLPAPPVAAPGAPLVGTPGSDAGADVSASGFDAWAYESSIPEEASTASHADVKKEPLPSWWSGGGGDSPGTPPGSDGGPPPVSAVVEVLEVAGTVSADAVRALIAGNHGRVQGCYVSAIGRDPEAKGNLRARFIVGANGRLVKAARGAGDLHDQRLIQCLLRVHEGLQFPPAGAPYTISVAIHLKQPSQ